MLLLLLLFDFLFLCGFAVSPSPTDGAVEDSLCNQSQQSTLNLVLKCFWMQVFEPEIFMLKGKSSTPLLRMHID